MHHYDANALLSPPGRTESGYRLYSEGDVGRLHQILLYRELEFSLDVIGRVLDEPALDRRGCVASAFPYVGFDTRCSTVNSTSQPRTCSNATSCDTDLVRFAGSSSR